MEISLIIVLIFAEILLVLIGVCTTLTYLLVRKPKSAVTEDAPLSQSSAEDELDGLDLANSYIDYLDQAMDRNTTKTKQQENLEIELDGNSIEETGETQDNTEDENNAPAPDETQSKLLLAREQFLLMEKAAAEKTEHEIHFWDSIYDGMKKLLEEFSTTETSESTTTDAVTANATESKEKVFYVETQSKKIDGEVNKLKDIIYEQENALSSMKKALEGAGDEITDDSGLLDTLQQQMAEIERQLSDSKMCMEVLEMENNRLQEEIDKVGDRHSALFSEDDNSKSEESDSVIDLDQMREVVEKQENKILQLIDTIESLEIDASQAEKLKSTISDFARTSKEMMGCISILEEENERLQSTTESGDETEEASASNDEEIESLKNTINKLEEDIIKKDVVHAQLQDEFTSMETEYLAMYEAMHGDNS